VFYDRFLELCEAKGIKPKKAVTDMELSNSIATAWKNRGLTPKSDTLAKIAQYFNVPIDFFLERPPFDYWELINADRKGFFQHLDVDFDLINLAWGFDKTNPDDIPIIVFIQFLDGVVEFARPTENGGWVIITRPLYQKEKTPAVEGGQKRKLRSIARLESSDITPELDKNIADYIDFLLRRRDSQE